MLEASGTLTALLAAELAAKGNRPVGTACLIAG